MDARAGKMIWRLINSGPADGATNMALDDALMSGAATTPTLRFYTWSTPCLSIGYSQHVSRSVDVEACSHLGIELVRRPTGGAAVLHDIELTYCLVAPETHPAVSGSIVESYRKISRGLVAGMACLGLECEVSQQARPGGRNSAACFETPSAYEITADGRKVVGSAQCRRDGVVLQHGSLLLEVDRERISQVLRFPRLKEYSIRAGRLLAGATSLHEVVGRVVSFEEASSAMVTGFQDALGIELRPGCLTPEENRLARGLRQMKYSNPAWTMMW